jgi:hypothetical protein
VAIDSVKNVRSWTICNPIQLSGRVSGAMVCINSQMHSVGGARAVRRMLEGGQFALDGPPCSLHDSIEAG